MTTTPAVLLDTGTRLAVDRTRLAYERTLMAWVRTATSLISFGFTIYKFFEFESGRAALSPVSSRLVSPRQFAMVMIGIGVISLALATYDHRRNMQRMAHQYGTADRSVAMTVALIVSLMGLMAFLAALVRG